MSCGFRGALSLTFSLQYTQLLFVQHYRCNLFIMECVTDPSQKKGSAAALLQMQQVTVVKSPLIYLLHCSSVATGLHPSVWSHVGGNGAWLGAPDLLQTQELVVCVIESNISYGGRSMQFHSGT